MNDLRYNYQNYTMLIIKINFLKYKSIKHYKTI